MAKLNKKKVKKAITGSGGVLSVLAEKCDVSRSAITQFLQKKRNQDVKELIEQEKERIIDLAENKLHGLINKEDFQAIKYFLNTKGKSRGYVERQEMEHLGTAATFNLIEKSVEEIKDAKARNKPGPRASDKPEASTNPEGSK